MTLEHPDHGGRVRLELLETGAQGASYAVTLFVADARWDAAAHIDLSEGAAQPQPSAWKVSSGASGDPPGWLLRYAMQMMAVLQRDHREAQGARWPRRILRWRAERA